MTTEQKILRAIAIIGPSANSEKVKRIVVDLDASTVKRRPGKKSKKAAERFAAALHKLKRVGASPDLEWLPIDEVFTEKVDGVLEDAINASLRPFVRRGPTNDAKQFAARAAAHLLTEHRLRLTVSSKSKFCRLAASLFDDESASMVRTCRTVLSEIERTGKF